MPGVFLTSPLGPRGRSVQDFLPLMAECFFSLVHFHIGFFINVSFGKQLAKLGLISKSKS